MAALTVQTRQLSAGFTSAVTKLLLLEPFNPLRSKSSLVANPILVSERQNSFFFFLKQTCKYYFDVSLLPDWEKMIQLAS